MLNEQDKLMVCEDCALYIANGELPPDVTEERQREIEMGVSTVPGWLAMNGDHDDFSWKPCDCCKSSLGGAREGVTRFEYNDPNCPPEARG